MEENKTEQGYCYKYPRPAVTTDVVLFAMVDSQMKVLLIQGGRDPYKGQWAFPVDFSIWMRPPRWVRCENSRRRRDWNWTTSDSFTPSPASTAIREGARSVSPTMS